MNSIRKNLTLSGLSGILLSIPFLVPHTGLIMLFAFVPLLWMEHAFTISGNRGAWKYYALTFLTWNVLTVFWISYSTLVGGIMAILGNAFQMFSIFAVFRRVKRWILRKGKPEFIAHIFLAALWIAWEFFYFDAEISFPWLVLGNGFATNVSLVQWYEMTGVLGGSLWIWVLNILVYYGCRVKPREWKSAAIPMVIMIVLPITVSLIRFYTYKEPNLPVEVVVVQPNIDPYKEKFSSMPQSEQDKRILGLASSHITPETQLVVTPETSIREVVLGDYFPHHPWSCTKSSFRKIPIPPLFLEPLWWISILGQRKNQLWHPVPIPADGTRSSTRQFSWIRPTVYRFTTNQNSLSGRRRCPIQTCSPSLKTWL